MIAEAMRLSDSMIVLPGAALLGLALAIGPPVIISLITQQPITIMFSDAERRLCDQAVEALLYSKELVEVQRAAALVHEIPCGIGRRLPK